MIYQFIQKQTQAAKRRQAHFNLKSNRPVEKHERELPKKDVPVGDERGPGRHVRISHETKAKSPSGVAIGKHDKQQKAQGGA